MHPTQKVLEERCFATPNILRTLDVANRQCCAAQLARSTPIMTTGIGASEGPARILASCLSGGDHNASFIPLSGLLAGEHRSWCKPGNSSCLVVFSQGISPNARLAIEAGHEFGSTLIVTAAKEPSLLFQRDRPPHSVEVLRHPPEDETGFLVRVTGPAVASAIAISIAAQVADQMAPNDIAKQLQTCADWMDKRLRETWRDVDCLDKPPAFLVYGRDGVERNHLLRWTLLECFDHYDPPTWDLLAFAHGAFQNMYEDARTLILPYSRQDAAIVPVLVRLREMLGQTRHTLLEIPSDLPRPWCFLEHLAATQSLVLAHLRNHPRNLNNWPGRGKDAPIYGLDSLPST